MGRESGCIHQKMSSVKRVLFIGPSPRNTGGVSIHIRRLTSMLSTDITSDFVDEGRMRYEGVFNLRSMNVITYVGKIILADVIHIHSGAWLLRSFHIIVCKILMGKYTVVTVHRDPTIEPHLNLTRWLLKRCNQAILVNKKGYDIMSCPAECKYRMLPAFLPPIMREEPPLPEEITLWINNVRKNDGNIIMCSNAWNLVQHDGQDLYGLDMCIDAMISLNEIGRNYYLIFIVASNTDQQDRMKAYKQKISEKHLQHNILIWEDAVSFVRLIQKSDMVLRPTNTDGDAISIREALYMGKPVIASDIVERPEGTILFRTRDTDDFVKKIRDSDIRVRDNFKESVKYYRELYLNIYNQ